MGKVVKRAAPVIGAVVGNAIAPGIGGVIGGGLGGGLSGGGIKGVGLGALGGGLSGFAPALGSAAGNAFGVTSASGLGALSSGISGAGLGLATGNPVNALTGAALGGLGGYITSGGSVPGLGNMGTAPYQGPLQPGTSFPSTEGSGLLGSLGGLTNAGTGGQPMSLGSLLSTAGGLYGNMQGQKDLDKIQRMMAQRSGQAQQLLQPYTQAGETALANMQAPSMEALQNDPGYQFRLQEGQRALERSQAARGGLYSGAALRAAQEYGQGLADQTYNDYFRRQGILANQGLGAAGNLGSLYTNLASAQAAAEIARMNQRNQMYSGLGGLVGGLFG